MGTLKEMTDEYVEKNIRTFTDEPLEYVTRTSFELGFAAAFKTLIDLSLEGEEGMEEGFKKLGAIDKEVNAVLVSRLEKLLGIALGKLKGVIKA